MLAALQLRSIRQSMYSEYDEAPYVNARTVAVPVNKA